MNETNINNEVNIEEIPVNETKPKKKKKSVIFILIFIFTLIISGLGIAIFIFLRPNNNDLVIIAYTNIDNETKYITNKNLTPNMIFKNSEFLTNDITLNKAKNKMLFIDDNDGLYILDLKSSNEAEKISNNVNDYYFLDDNSFYYIEDNSLYIASDYSNKNKIDMDVVRVNNATKDYIIYSKDKELFIYNYKKDEKSKVSSELFYFFDSSDDSILYINEKKDLILYKIQDDDNNVIDKEVVNVISYNDDLSIIFYTKVDKEINIYDTFIENDLNQNYGKCTVIDFDTSIWDWPDHRTKLSDPANSIYYLYDYYGYKTYLDSNGELKNYTPDVKEKCDAVLLRENIESKFSSSNEDKLYLYKLFKYENDKTENVLNDFVDVNVIDNKYYIYTRYNVENKTKLSSIKTQDDLDNFRINEKYNSYILNSKNEVIDLVKDYTQVNVSGFSKIEGFYKNNKIYIYDFSTYTSNNGYTVLEYDAETLKLENKYEHIMEFAQDVLDYDFLYHEVTENSSDLVGIISGKKKIIDSNVFRFEYDKNNIYYYKDYSGENMNSSFIIYDKNHNKEELDDVYSVVNANNMLFILKDCSTKSNTCSLFQYKDKKNEKIEYNIKSFKSFK